MIVHLLEHLRIDEREWETSVLLGIFSSELLARLAWSRLAESPEYADAARLIDMDDPRQEDYESGFYVSPCDVESDMWSDGYCTVWPGQEDDGIPRRDYDRDRAEAERRSRTLAQHASKLPAEPGSALYSVEHLHIHDSGEPCQKRIGVYRSERAALAAVARARMWPGFEEFPDLIGREGESRDRSGFYVARCVLNEGVGRN